MSDDERGVGGSGAAGDDELSLPKATVQKLIHGKRLHAVAQVAPVGTFGHSLTHMYFGIFAQIYSHRTLPAQRTLGTF